MGKMTSRCSRFAILVELESPYKDKSSANFAGGVSRVKVLSLGAMDSGCQRDFKRDLKGGVNAWS
jgi:hypothetical protein